MDHLTNQELYNKVVGNIEIKENLYLQIHQKRMKFITDGNYDYNIRISELKKEELKFKKEVLERKIENIKMLARLRGEEFICFQTEKIIFKSQLQI